MWSNGLVIKADGSQSWGCEFEPRHRILDGCYVDCFTRHNRPATLEWRVNTQLMGSVVKNTKKNRPPWKNFFQKLGNKNPIKQKRKHPPLITYQQNGPLNIIIGKSHTLPLDFQLVCLDVQELLLRICETGFFLLPDNAAHWI